MFTSGMNKSVVVANNDETSVATDEAIHPEYNKLNNDVTAATAMADDIFVFRNSSQKIVS